MCLYFLFTRKETVEVDRHFVPSRKLLRKLAETPQQKKVILGNENANYTRFIREKFSRRYTAYAC